MLNLHTQPVPSRSRTGRREPMPLLSAALLTLGFTLLFVPIPSLSVIARPLLLLAVVPPLHLLRSVTRAQAIWLCLCGLFLLTQALSVPLAMNRDEAVTDLGRQTFICVWAALLSVCARSRAWRSGLYTAAFAASLAATAVVVLGYIKLMGLAFPSPLLVRAYKWQAHVEMALYLNPLSFFIVLSALLALPRWWGRAMVLPWYLPTILAALYLTGSRTSMVASVAGVVVYAVALAVRRRPTRLIAVILGLTVIASAVVFSGAFQGVDIESANDALSGRVDLWQTGLQTFWDNPLTGGGAEAWKVSLGMCIPTGTGYRSTIEYNLAAGSFHNAFISLLAEKGPSAFVCGLAMLALMLRQAMRAFANRASLSAGDRLQAAAAPLWVIVVIIRMSSEQAGLFGYASGAVDFASYAVGAMVFALSAAATAVQAPKPATRPTHTPWALGSTCYAHPYG